MLDCADLAHIRHLFLRRDIHITSLYAENTA